MRVVVLNGSPKGERSVTMRYMYYLQKNFPEHEFEYIHASLYCGKMDKNPGYFEQVIDAVRKSDAVVWAFPLYYMLVHSQYKRFIELIFERQCADAFRGRYAVALSTSIHFFDHTAHNYIRAVCEDMGMRYIDFYPAKMEDLLKKEKQESLLNFFRRIERAMDATAAPGRAFAPLPDRDYSFVPEGDYHGRKISGMKAVVVADMQSDRPAVAAMARYFAGHFENCGISDIRAIDFGPCLGCVKCGFDNICAYDGKDEFIPLLKDRILPGDVIVFALGMRDRHFSSLWQRYLERNFVNTHIPVLRGKQLAFLVSGPLSFNHNAREILQAYTENMQGALAGIISDESGSSSDVCGEMDVLASEMALASKEGSSRPVTFLGAGGSKVLRDDLYEGLRFVFQADHRYYRKYGMYDFPRRKISVMLLVLLTKIPPLRKRIRNEMIPGMLRPFNKVLR
jgi:multimeric flavodoxin WrbA